MTNLCFANLKVLVAKSQTHQECADLAAQVDTLWTNQKLVLLIKVLQVIGMCAEIVERYAVARALIRWLNLARGRERERCSP